MSDKLKMASVGFLRPRVAWSLRIHCVFWFRNKCCYIMNYKANGKNLARRACKQSSPAPGIWMGGAWMGGVALPLDVVDNFIIMTVSVVFVINYIYLYFRY